MPPSARKIVSGSGPRCTTCSGSGGICLDVGCGTGANAAVADLGWNPIGVDLSERMLGYAAPRLAVALGDAAHLPVRTGSAAAAIAMLVHTDMPGYPEILRDIARCLRPGSVLVHIGPHPCFCGGFADRSDREAIVIRRGYQETHWTKASHTNVRLRDKVGAMHRPLAELLNAFAGAGFRLERFAELGGPTPLMLAIQARAHVS